jgi:phage-related minor tail protein
MADAGNVTLRLSVRDQEVVRQALAQLGKDGEAIGRRLESSTQGPSRSAAALANAFGSVADRVSGLAFSIGPVGSALVQLGPVGLVAAAGVGAIAGALEKVAEGNKAFNAYSRQIKEAASITGLSIPEFQALDQLFQRRGVDADQSASGINKFAIAHHSAAEGQGELYQALRKVDPELARQFALANSTSAALDIFAQAMAKSDKATQAFLTRAAFGRGAAGLGPALLDLAGQGGLGAVTNAAVRAGTAFDKSVIEKQAQAAIEAERRSKITENNWNRAYSAIYEKWKEFKNAIGLGPDNEIKVSVFVRNAAEGTLSLDRRPAQALVQERETVRKAVEEAQRAFDALRPPALPEGIDTRALEMARRAAGAASLPPRVGAQDAETARQNLAELRRREDELTQAIDRRSEASREGNRNLIPPDGVEQKRQEQITALTIEIEKDKQRAALLGNTVQAQRLLLEVKEKEARLTQLNRPDIQVSDKELQLAREIERSQLSAAQIGRRTTLGVAGETERRVQFERELNVLIAEGTVKESERAQVMALYNKTLRETVEQEQVRKSLTPALTQFAIDSKNALKAVDQAAAQAFNSVGDGVADVVLKVKSASDALKSIVDQLLRSLIKMGVNSLLGPLAGNAGGLFKGIFGSAQGNVFNFGSPVPFASGTVLTRPTFFPMANGGVGLAGEAGPEGILPLRRNGRGQLGVISSGGGRPAGIFINHTVENHVPGLSFEQKTSRDGIDVRTIVTQVESALAANIASGHGGLSKVVERRPTVRRG